jgi:hypothetical protein
MAFTKDGPWNIYPMLLLPSGQTLGEQTGDFETPMIGDTIILPELPLFSVEVKRKRGVGQVVVVVVGWFRVCTHSIINGVSCSPMVGIAI